MRVVAALLILLGIASYFQYKQGWNLSFLNWVNNWGPDNANYMRIGVVVIGLVLLIADARRRANA